MFCHVPLYSYGLQNFVEIEILLLVKEHRGRNLSAIFPENVSVTRKMFIDDNRFIYQILHKEINIAFAAIYKMIHEELLV